MDDRYEPPSDFLCAAIAENIPFTGSDQAEENYRRLLGMVHDPHPANRDWAALLISQLDRDTPELRAALLAAAEDENSDVRGEAIAGLASRDRALALPLVRRELAQNSAWVSIFEAAASVANPSLVDLLREYAATVEDAWISELLEKAIEACETGEPRRDYRGG